MLSALAPCVMHHPDMKHSKMEDFTNEACFRLLRRRDMCALPCDFFS
jgi:hypothetical protein